MDVKLGLGIADMRGYARICRRVRQSWGELPEIRRGGSKASDLSLVEREVSGISGAGSRFHLGPVRMGKRQSALAESQDDPPPCAPGVEHGSIIRDLIAAT